MRRAPAMWSCASGRPIWPTSPSRRRAAGSGPIRSRSRTTASSRVQLKSRHWYITDGLNRLEEVTGRAWSLTAHAQTPRRLSLHLGLPLSTPSGSMQGAYQMQSDDGEAFDVAIPEFSLDLPGARRVVNWGPCSSTGNMRPSGEVIIAFDPVRTFGKSKERRSGTDCV